MLTEVNNARLELALLAIKAGLKMIKTLDLFKPSETGRVKRVTATGAVRRRLFDMGITPSADITMRKAAPLGDPIEIIVRSYELTLRKSEAALIELEVE